MENISIDKLRCDCHTRLDCYQSHRYPKMLPFSRQALARSSSSLIAQRTSQQACTRVGGFQRRWLTMEELNRQRGGNEPNALLIVDRARWLTECPGRERVVVLGSGTQNNCFADSHILIERNRLGRLHAFSRSGPQEISSRGRLPTIILRLYPSTR